MGGRGGKSGLSPGGGYGGFGTLQGLIGAMQEAQQQNSGAGNGGNLFNAGEGNSNPDYNDNGNPQLVKWQNQTDENKMAAFLAKMGKQQTPAQDAEGYAYYQSAFQNMVIQMGLNAPVFAKLSKSDFDKYVAANGLTPIYRGWQGGKASKDRFENAAMSHTGTGMYGEGFYFGSASTASGYSGGALTKAALSPNARVVDLNTVRGALSGLGGKVQSAFSHSGHVPGSSFQPNHGEAQMALKMGYNVIRTDWSYVILTRDAVVVQK